MTHHSSLSQCRSFRVMVASAAAFVMSLAPGAVRSQVVFDFDSATPTLATGNNVPFDQTENGLTATFSSPEGLAYSIQSSTSVPSLVFSQFSGNYLYPNGTSPTRLDITFDQPVSAVTLTFATMDATQTEYATLLQLTAYSDSTVVGTPTTARGNYNNVFPNGTDSRPMGTLSFSSPDQSFNRIELVKSPVQADPANAVNAFATDNIQVTPVPEPGAYALAVGVALLGFSVWRQHRNRKAIVSPRPVCTFCP